MKNAFVIGVDAGGTKTHIRIRDAKGTLVAEAFGGSGNVHTDHNGAIARISTAIDDAIRDATLQAVKRSNITLGIGLAGLVSGSDPARIAKSFADFGNITVASDAETACIGAHDGADGGIVVAGTGSAGFARIKKKHFAVGGRGFLVSDEGSGARIGADAIRHALLAAEGLADDNAFTQKVMARFEHDPFTVTRWSKTALPADYAALAPIVLGYAEKGDTAALAIAKHHARALMALAIRLKEFGAPRLALVGGLSPKILPWIHLEEPELFDAPLHDAADGAILLAGGVIA